MELVPYAAADMWLTEALETDERLMAELGGPWPGRGYASEALRILLERARADGRWGAVHALPGVTNVPSNALCRTASFVLLGEQTVDYGGRALHCNHWVLEPPDHLGVDPREPGGT